VADPSTFIGGLIRIFVGLLIIAVLVFIWGLAATALALPEIVTILGSVAVALGGIRMMLPKKPPPSK